MFIVNRKYRGRFPRRRGGVAALVRKEVGLKMSARWSSQDVLVLEGGSVVMVGAYILPEYRDWSEWTDVDPWVKLVEVATHFSRNNGDGGEKAVLVAGDLNARTKAKQGEGVGYARVSEDHRNASPRGNELVKMCGDNGLTILNGVPQFCVDGSSGNFTSHPSSGNGKAVVDYIMGNAVLLSRVESFKVLPRETSGAPEAVKHPPRPKMKLPSATLLDRTLIETVKSKAPLQDRLNNLYGARLFEPEKTITVYTDGSCIGNGKTNSRAGAGIFYGEGNARNKGVRVPGPAETNNRGEIYAIRSICLLSGDQKRMMLDGMFRMGTYSRPPLTQSRRDAHLCGWCK
ncbi:hypothetical protein BKA70DRAFT_1356972 [Coprinopsis sp. MPI-PUGE-AT-0042]|nr:hypothetical protein BKA70DRAFT_1356972 [Coprinopsis sp. MPI-PUGE-AT-0042]